MFALRSARLLSRTPVTAALRPVAALQQLPQHMNQQRRWTTYASVVNFPREEISNRLTLLEDAVLGVNWGDYFILIQDQPFWEAELDQLDHYCQPYLSDPEIGPKLQRVHKMFDCLAQLEDCRDYMNELGEVMTRASGLMGTGLGAGEKIDNMEEIAAHCGNFYEEMNQTYPEFKPKVEQVVGQGLAVLRQKSKFRFGSMHRYSF
jgi:hypothetical protein